MYDQLQLRPLIAALYLDWQAPQTATWPGAGAKQHTQRDCCGGACCLGAASPDVVSSDGVDTAREACTAAFWLPESVVAFRSCTVGNESTSFRCRSMLRMLLVMLKPHGLHLRLVTREERHHLCTHYCKLPLMPALLASGRLACAGSASVAWGSLNTGGVPRLLEPLACAGLPGPFKKLLSPFCRGSPGPFRYA